MTFMTEDNFSKISFPLAGGTLSSVSQELREIEKILGQFASNWKRSLDALLSTKHVSVSLVQVSEVPFSDFVARKTDASDFQVFEIEALEGLCVWGLDLRLVSVVVDCMFGGQGKLPAPGVIQRPWTPIEQRIRHRLWESLANAYEAPWQSLLPQRLHVLRQEQLARNLRLTQSQSPVFAAEFSIELNHSTFTASFCLPVSPQLQALWSGQDGKSAAAGEAVWGRELRQQLKQAPLEATALLAEQAITVGQLLQLSVGQVLPLDLRHSVDVRIEGRSMLSGRYGVKNNKYAVKIDSVFDELDLLLERQKLDDSQTVDGSQFSSNEEFLASPLKSVAEAFQDFEQQVASGGRVNG